MSNETEMPKKFLNGMSMLLEIEKLYEQVQDSMEKKWYLEKAIQLHQSFISVDSAIALARDAYSKARENCRETLYLAEKALTEISKLEKVEKKLGDLLEKENKQ